ncbi:hypothetical protein [Carboxylicivirga caseinilyticus]|uniref:hypothetical protein n=1 Tax=Carboxylicivirga caseinilyticus TaxID=3417572 RepID=UPI003D33B9C8|nr:hypothetical protein [Marinilabiliaceae bacterium A049]
MKLFRLLILIGVMIPGYLNAQTNAEKVSTFFSKVLNLSEAKLNADRPIANINQLAAHQADTMLVINNSNAK